MTDGLTHIDRYGHAVMVDVTEKPATLRRAETRCVVTGIRRSLEQMVVRSQVDVLGAARMAGLQAAKVTSTLIPLCHPLPLTELSVDFSVHRDCIEVFGAAETVGQTGVETEALTACTVAALSIFCAVRDLDPEASIERLTLWDKSGGRSGHWVRIGDDHVVADPGAEDALTVQGDSDDR